MATANEEFQIIQKTGWWDKEIARSYVVIMKYRQRFLILTNTHLKYYHQSPLEQGSTALPAKEIPLVLVNEHALIQHSMTEPEILHIETDHKIYRFRGSSVEEVTAWRTAIVMSRTKLSHVKVHFAESVAGQQSSKSSSASSPAESKPSSTSTEPVTDWKLVFAACTEDVMALEQATCSTIERAKYTANTFFESLLSVPSKERNLIAKDMGKALLVWMDQDEDMPILNSTNLLSTSHRYCTKLEVFTIWLRVALSREYLMSCKFDENGGNDDGDDSSQSSSNMTHSTIKSRMRKARNGSIIMPFRADTAECLFLSAIIHASSSRYNLLNELLHAMLKPVAQAPESFQYPRSVAMIAPAIISMPMEVGSAQSSQRPSMVEENSTYRKSRKFIGGIVRSVFRRPSTATNIPTTNAANVNIGSTINNNNNTNNSVPSSDDKPNTQANNRNSRGGSLRLDRDSLNLSDGNRTEDAQLTPMEMKRIEVRRRLLDSTLIFSRRFEESSSTFPIAIRTIIETVRDLIIVTQAPPDTTSGGVVRREDSSSSSADAAAVADQEEKIMQFNNRRRFEYGTFFTSCSAMLFLRLICRAIISPEDYGVLGPTPVIPTKVDSDTSFKDGRKAFSAMVILSHVLKRDAARKVEDAVTADAKSGGKVKRGKEMEAPFSGSILTSAEEICAKAPRDAVHCFLDHD